ncbi:sugar transferase [Pseudaestuariivita atlantica]|uniref:Sugar transferase n=1 Tax=Pseudaestuariivita atlantica TaxID=1317121 RepID=A0A0L1JQ88_9RHOB|nr:sugar transferase [Pseudaestuariivita atlantica]KNG93911.1 sugar transferase [Pseudaestuariivita atlantica]
MTPLKRLLDVVGSLVLMVVLSPLILWCVWRILKTDGRPILYVSERMKTPTKGFQLLKFRTMTVDDKDAGVSGGDKAHRITETGRKLRAKRLDELPQLWNIFKGDISFVGPRPELRRYVEMRPDLFERVLRARPGVTGLATLVFHKREGELLDPCTTPEETEEVYARRCLPAKARIDMIYAENRNFCYDWQLMFASVFKGVSVRQSRSKASDT